ncbi:MAG: DUF3842 family protein [Pyramidobacter sp.]|nr:DUF3842 family protein [Pyramidobacter sp.]
MAKTTILVVDAQGGGLGRQLVAGIKKLAGKIGRADVCVEAVGTNSIATAAMLKAGADAAATGENSVVVACRSADLIVGPIGIVIADAMLGEITPKMAAAVAQAPARRILIPFQHCDTCIVGVSDGTVSRLTAEALERVEEHLTVNV